MNNSIITAVFGHDRKAKTREVFQWDYGMTLRFRGVALPEYYTVHFSSQQMSGTAKKQVGDANGVAIPDEYLTTGQPVYAWTFLHDGATDGESVYMVEIPVKQRPQPTEEEPAPAQQGVIEEAIAALNAGVADVHAAMENVQQTVDDALQAARDSGEFDGPQGPRGEQGIPGPKGDKGDPGEVMQADFDALKQYVTEMSPVVAIGPSPVASVSDAAPLDAEGLVVGIEPVQSGSGDPSPDNVCPISGWTGANITVNGSTVSITFPAEAGTVYGGTLDVVKGMLTLTHKGGLFGDLYSSGLNAMTTNVSGVRRWGLPKSMFDGIATAVSNNRPEDFLCSAYKTISAADTLGRNNGISVTESGLVVIFDENYSDSATTTNSGAVAYFSDINPFFVWKLATPITYQLTPQEIALLRGNNSVFADCGNTSLKYRANLSTYIDERIRVTQSIIAGIETSTIATRAYSAGELLIIGDMLYKTTTSISNGATFTPGTNVIATTVVEQLILLANA